MYQIHEEFSDSLNPRRKSYCYLNPERPIIFGYEDYPIKWTGTIAGKKIEVLQKVAIMDSTDDIEFIEFPEEYDGMKIQVINWINENLDSYLN